MEGQDMTDYIELVKSLRLCQFGECGCGKCYYKELKGDWCTEDNHPEFFDCDDKLKLDAAAAIEEMQAELAGSKDAIRILKHNLETKKPKRGRWVGHGSFEVFGGDKEYWMACGNPIAMVTCSECNSEPLCNGIEEYQLSRYCPNCGARMEVQDD